MRRREVFLALLLAGLLGLGGAVLYPAFLAGAPADVESVSVRASGQPKDPPEPGDAWLARICLDELHRGLEAGEYEAVGETAKSAVLARLACGKTDDLAALNDLVYVLRACRYLPLVERTPEGRKSAIWLLANRPVTRLLFRALQDTNAPPRRWGE